jgi:hypothetical protein
MIAFGFCFWVQVTCSCIVVCVDPFRQDLLDPFSLNGFVGHVK